MAQYEIRKVGSKAKTPEHTEHDKGKAIDWANAYTLEHNVLMEVHEIKHVHLTTLVKQDDMAFF